LDAHSISEIRKVNFAHAVRGYDRGEVDRYLRELADWLERDSGVGMGSEQVRAELERTGEQVAGILTEAHDAAGAIREEATAEARRSLVKANATAESLRGAADEYAEQTREEADLHARKVRGEADAYAEQVREQTDAASAESRQAAEREAEKIVADANQRRRDIEAVISDLTERRDAVLAELDRLASGIAGTATQHRGERPGEGAPDELETAEAASKEANQK
jgi:DivIVA domain-containing protein